MGHSSRCIGVVGALETIVTPIIGSQRAVPAGAAVNAGIRFTRNFALWVSAIFDPAAPEVGITLTITGEDPTAQPLVLGHPVGRSARYFFDENVSAVVIRSAGGASVWLEDLVTMDNEGP